MKTVVVRHLTTGELRTLDVVRITAKYVEVYWPLSGAYEIHVKENRVRACSPKARRKNPYVPWAAVDIEGLREAVRVHIDGESRRGWTEKRMSVHNATMPGISNAGIERGKP